MEEKGLEIAKETIEKAHDNMIVANQNNQEVTVEATEPTVREQLFKIHGNEERNKFVITVGNHLATKKTFETQEEAEEYISEPKWDTVFALVTEMLTIQDGEIGEKVNTLLTNLRKELKLD